jgi:hypothetical protein
MNVLEDEYHFVITCSAYRYVRTTHYLIITGLVPITLPNNKTNCHDIIEILLNVALNTIILTMQLQHLI